MPHYKDQNNKLYFLDSTEFAHLIPAGCVSITDAEAEVIRNPPETPEQAAARLERAVERHMDSVAQAKGYDDRKTCTLRAGYAGPWQAEGQAFGAWMDNCWAYCYQVQGGVIAGVRGLPTESELLTELPAMVWPV